MNDEGGGHGSRLALLAPSAFFHKGTKARNSVSVFGTIQPRLPRSGRLAFAALRPPEPIELCRRVEATVHLPARPRRDAGPHATLGAPARDRARLGPEVRPGRRQIVALGGDRLPISRSIRGPIRADAEITAQDRHKSARVLPRYAKRTMKQVAEGAQEAALNENESERICRNEQPPMVGMDSDVLRNALKLLATPAGLEPATCRLEGGCSIQLSYGAEPYEPTEPCVTS